MRIIITGTPGTGKTSISKMLAIALSSRLICVNELVRKERMYSRIEEREYVADFKKLKKRLLLEIKKNPDIIVESHLLCDLKLPGDLVIVLRCKPKELEKRLAKRGYKQKKLKENVMSEILDYCYIKAIGNFGIEKVMQVDTSSKIGTKTLIAEIAAFEKTKISREVRWLWDLTQKELGHYS